MPPFKSDLIRTRNFGTIKRQSLKKQSRSTESEMSSIYRADHIGSLLRPAELLAARTSHANGAIDHSQLREVEDQSILQALELQRDTGMEVFTDGEYRRDSFLGGPPQWLNGFSAPEESFLREWHGPNGGMLPTRVRAVSGRLEAKGRFTGQEISFMKKPRARSDKDNHASRIHAASWWFQRRYNRPVLRNPCCHAIGPIGSS